MQPQTFYPPRAKSKARESRRTTRNHIPNRLTDLRLPPARVDDGAAVGVGRRDRKEGGPQSLVELKILAFEAIDRLSGLAPSRSAQKPLLDRQVENKGQVWTQVA